VSLCVFVAVASAGLLLETQVSSQRESALASEHGSEDLEVDFVVCAERKRKEPGQKHDISHWLLALATGSRYRCRFSVLEESNIVGH
jgi:hypothetical protein